MVWMDLEMTGLDPDTDTIIEIATIITNSQLEVIKEGPSIAIHQPDDVLARMDPWCVEHHGASGLTQRVKNSKITLARAEDESLAFIREYCHEKMAPLCGSSIHQDRRFLVRYMPKLNAFLHYRMIDVSTIKELVDRWYPFDKRPPPKNKNHLAMEDVRESLAELTFYRQTFFR